MGMLDTIVDGLEERGHGLASWVGRGQIEEVRFSDNGKQILLEVVPIPEFDPNDTSADYAVTMRLLSVAVQSSGVVFVPPAVGDHCVYIAEDGDPTHGGYVIGYQNNDEDPIPTGMDLDKFLVRLPDGVDGEIRRGDVRVIFEGSKITVEGTNIEIGINASKGAAREDDTVSLGTWTYTSAAGTGVTPGQISITPQGGGTPIVLLTGVATPLPNVGKISSSSSKTKIE